jgi:ribonuclease P protein component
VSDNCRLPRTARIRDDAAIAALAASGPLRSRWFVLRRAENAVGYPRLAVRVAKKVVKASVARNRIRRLVRETFRLRRAQLPARDFLVTVRVEPQVVAMAEARQDLERLLSRT